LRRAPLAEFFGLLGGGQRDAHWDGSLRPASRLAILPGRTHYDMLAAPALGEIVASFTAAPPSTGPVTAAATQKLVQ
jgi:hypothetical protein